MRLLASVLALFVVLSSVRLSDAGLAGPDPAQFLKLYDTEVGRRYMIFYVLGGSDALQLSDQIECSREKGTGPSAETMTARVADVLRGQDPPKAVAIAVVRVLREGGCTRPTR
jgi:hypothetical protein